MGYRNTRELGDIFFRETTRDQFNNESVFYFEADYAIPRIMFVYDIFICLAVLVGLTCACCGLKKSWYYVLLEPFSCVVVHSYHILIGYIHAPHYASAILAISVLVFVVTYRAAYYNLVHYFRKCKRLADECTGTTTSDEPVCDLATCIDPIKKHTICCVLCICCAKYFNPEISGIPCIGRRLSFWEDGIGKSVIHSCLLFTFVVLS